VTRESPQVSHGFRVRTTGIASTGPVLVIQSLIPSLRNLRRALPHSLFSLLVAYDRHNERRITAIGTIG